VLRAEAIRLEAMVRDARRKAILPSKGSA